MKFIYSFFLVFLLISCTNSSDKSSDLESENLSDVWRVNINSLKEGAPFPLVNEPVFKGVDDIIDLKDNNKALVLKFKDEIRVYPYIYTDFSEVVNDSFLSNDIAVSYCPQTKSGICFNRKIGGVLFDNLIASGYLLHDNLVLSDTSGNFFWSQMLIEGIRGDMSYNNIESFFAIEMNWYNIKKYLKNAKVYYRKLASNKSSNIKNVTKGFNEEKYFGVINNNKDEKLVSVYSYDYFIELKLDVKNINQRKTIIIGDKSIGYITAFYVPNDTELSVLRDEFPFVLKDNRGRKWDVFGYSSDGQRLESPSFFVAELWAWRAFYSEVEMN